MSPQAPIGLSVYDCALETAEVDRDAIHWFVRKCSEHALP